MEKINQVAGEKILFVKSSTGVGKLAGSIINAQAVSDVVRVRSVGAGAVNQTVKAIILANKSYAKDGMVISCVPAFLDSTDPDVNLTVVELCLKLHKV